jgi:hypothetical protein
MHQFRLSACLVLMLAVLPLSGIGAAANLARQAGSSGVWNSQDDGISHETSLPAVQSASGYACIVRS